LQQKHQADVVCCDFVKTYGDDAQYSYNQASYLFTNHEACMALMGRWYLPLVIACCKMYRREIVRNHPFPLGKIHEDEATTCKFLYAAKTVVLCEDKLYGYYHNPNSIMNDGKRSNYQAKLWALSARAEYFESVGEPMLAKTAWSMNVRHLIDEVLAGEGSLRKIVLPYIRKNRIMGKLNLKTWVKLMAVTVAPGVVSRDVQRRQQSMKE
jgi:hypothetical protein